MQERQVAWWQIAILIPIMIVLLLLERAMHFPGVSEQIADEGIVLFTFGGMFLWTRVNEGPLEEYFDEQDAAWPVGGIAPEESRINDGKGECSLREAVRQSTAASPARRTN